MTGVVRKLNSGDQRKFRVCLGADNQVAKFRSYWENGVSGMCSRYKRKFGENQITKLIRKIFLEIYKIQFSFRDLSCET